jgi:hypothetical protein
MKKVFNDIWASFNNHEKGASARKLTAFALMVLIAYIHYKELSQTNATEFLIIDLCGVFLSLGLVTFAQIIELKNGKTNSTEQNSE